MEGFGGCSAKYDVVPWCYYPGVICVIELHEDSVSHTAAAVAGEERRWRPKKSQGGEGEYLCEASDGSVLLATLSGVAALCGCGGRCNAAAAVRESNRIS